MMVSVTGDDRSVPGELIMTRWIATLTLPLSLLFLACDAEPVDERSDESPLAVAEEVSDPGQADELDPSEAHDRRSAKRGRKGPPAERLCAAIGCDDAQTTAIHELFARSRPAKAERKAHREAAKAEGAEHRSALAEAFREGTLSADAITRQRPRKPGSDRGETLVQLHALLTPDQREQVADMIAERGPKLFGKQGRKGKRGGEGKRHRKGEGKGKGKGKRNAHSHGDGAPTPEAELAASSGPKSSKKIDRLCSKVECTDEQRSALLAKATELHPKPSKEDREARKAERSRAHTTLATAFRGESFSAADLEALSAEREAKREAKGQAKGQMLLALQEVLTGEQRALVADMLAERGVRGVLGGKHGKHGKRDKHGKSDKHGKRGKHGKHGKRRGDGSRDRHDAMGSDHA